MVKNSISDRESGVFMRLAFFYALFEGKGGGTNDTPLPRQSYWNNRKGQGGGTNNTPFAVWNNKRYAHMSHKILCRVNRIRFGKNSARGGY